MRIIAGSARGRKIEAPTGENTRPTGDRVKEALFGILQREVPGASVLDLFGGSGSLALEAISRGAERATVNDAQRDCTSLVAKNAEALGFGDRIDIAQMDWKRCLASLAGRGAHFDLIFLDPPYATDLAQRALEAIGTQALLADGGIAVVERDARSVWQPDDLERVGLEAYDDRRYGATWLSFVRKRQNDEVTT